MLEHADRVAFFTPSICYDDARRYLPGLLTARRVDPEPALEVLDGFRAFVRPVDGSVYASAHAEALARIERRDAADWPILATALVLGLPIWTEDQDFFGTGVPTWTTDRVELYLNAAGPLHDARLPDPGDLTVGTAEERMPRLSPVGGRGHRAMAV